MLLHAKFIFMSVSKYTLIDVKVSTHMTFNHLLLEAVKMTESELRDNSIDTSKFIHKILQLTRTCMYI